MAAANVTRYKSFEINILPAREDAGETYYTYKILGNGLTQPIETSEQWDDEANALDFAKDFIDEHL